MLWICSLCLAVTLTIRLSILRRSHKFLKLISRTNYRVHELQLPSGTVLRQYVSRLGLIFAVTWSGPAMPDLRQSLGRYFDPYVAGVEANRTGHRQLRFQASDLVVHAGGHMRTFSGVAYLQSAVPAGVSPEELQ